MKKRTVKISLTNQIMVATILGIFWGVCLPSFGDQLQVIGDIFLRLIQMSVVVLVMGSVIEAVGKLDPKELGGIGRKVFLWFTGSTIVAAVVGLLFALILKPGTGIDRNTLGTAETMASVDTLEDLILNFIPVNIIQAMVEQNMIQVIIFSLLFGFSLSLIKDEKKNSLFLDLITSFNHVLLKMISLIMKLAPLGIFGLVASLVQDTGIRVLSMLVNFLFTFAVASFVFLFFWFVLTAFYCKVSFIRLIKNMWRVSVISFTTTSSAVSLPFQIEDGKEKLGISDRINKLVMPLAMTLNSNGLALFLSLAMVTIAQTYHIHLGFADFLQIILLSALACLGTIVVPGGGLVTLATVLPMVGLPTESIALLAGIDWFSGMFRTLLNVVPDMTVAMIVAHDEDQLDYEVFNKVTRDLQKLKT
ncbi:dicarboxylate/amino acid:cation symporter [Enterococcus sp.]|jgi:Na+/H+-dicarboxylate symporter|uniref:dicarboxylate/amino acid:cation symporter n=1 Tax=Enterococcus sp. TaxID=35783 RepID=UPI0025BAF546|nr:dicarboxylate/amino acid:cation symporter [Enterococcus sp.]